MARGKRNDRSRPVAPGAPAARGPSAGPSADDPDRPSAPAGGYEDVEFEEIDETGRPVPPPAAAAQGAGPDQVADRTEDQVMSQPDETRADGATPGADAVPPVSAPASGYDPPPPRRGGGGRGFLAGLLGGLLGGAAVLGGGGWYAYQNGPIQPILARLTALEDSVGEAKGGIVDVGQRVEQLGDGAGALETALQGADVQLQQLDQRLAATEEQAAEAGQRADARFAAVEAAFGDLRGTVDQASTSFRKAGEEVIGRLEAVNAKLVEVEKAQPADVVDKGTVEGIAGKQAGIEQAQGRLEAGLARLEQLVAQGLEAGNQQGSALRTVVDSDRSRLDELGAQVRDLQALKAEVDRQAAAQAEQRAALQDTGTQIAAVRDAIDQRLQDVTGKLTALDKQRERGVGLSLAVDSLETAVQTGQPFKPTLEVMGQLGQGDAVVEGTVSKLQPLAENGIPTVAELAKGIADIERSLTPVQQGEAQDWLERTRQNLQGLVNVHGADAEDVPGLNAVTSARQSVLLQDLEGAIQAMAPLAQQGNAQAAAWVEAARSRVEARGAVETLRQHVKTLLARQD